MSKVVLVCGSDWEGLYIDGKLKKETHMLAADQVLDTLNIKYEYVEVESDKHWEAWGGSLPSQLAIVKKDLAGGWPG